MKNIKTFEKYQNFDPEYGDIAEEYAKLIISEFIDRQDETSTLESVYAEIIKGDELEEEQAYIIKNTLQDYLYTLYEEAEKIRPIQDIDANKYNL